MLQQARRQRVSQPTKDDRSMCTLGSSRASAANTGHAYSERGLAQPQRSGQPQQQQKASLVQPPKIPAGTRWQPCSSPPRDRSELRLAPGQNKRTHPGPAARHTCPITSTGAAVGQAAWWASPTRQAETGRRELAPDLFRRMDSRKGARLSHTIHQDTTTVPEQGSSPERNTARPSPSSG